jgi:hypothetical protein
MDGQGLLKEKRLELFDGKHLTFEHPVFKPGELEAWVQEFYYRFFTQHYAG